jgi:hypothetical protein
VKDADRERGGTWLTLDVAVAEEQDVLSSHLIAEVSQMGNKQVVIHRNGNNEGIVQHGIKVKRTRTRCIDKYQLSWRTMSWQRHNHHFEESTLRPKGRSLYP